MKYVPGLIQLCMLTGHVSMNGFLYEWEDRMHVLVECSLYDDQSDLSTCGECVFEDERISIGCVLQCKEKSENFF